MPHTLDDQAYRDLAERLANAKPCPFSGRVTADQIKIILGEHGDIWPVSVQPDREEE